MQFIKESSPHLHRKDSINRMLGDVLIALSPVIIFTFISYGVLALRNYLMAIVAIVPAEIIYVLIRNKIPYDGTKHSLKEHIKTGWKKYQLSNLLSSLVTAVIFAMVMPVATEPGWLIYIALFFGGLFGIVIGKLVFGGTGSNIFNPAVVGMLFAKLCFGSRYIYPSTWYMETGNAVLTGGTPLTALAENSHAGVNSFIGQFSNLSASPILDLLLGRVPGVMGEAFKIAILIGLVYLILRRAADWRVVVSYLGFFTVVMAIAGIFVAVKIPSVNYFEFVAFQLLSGGVLFGAVYMLTDPVTMPINEPGRYLYGVIAASITCIIRLFGAFPEGVAFSILLANMLSPLIDYPKWGNQAFTKKKVLVIIGVMAATLLIVCLTLAFAPEVAV